MKVAKQAVAFYCVRTGKPWYEFFDKLDLAMNTSYSEADDEIWTIKKALEVVLKDMSLMELKANKDEVKSEFDNEGRKNAGEFFTPLIWCAEARKYFDKYIPNWHDYTVWDASCYSMDTEILVRRRGNNFLNMKIIKSTIQYTIGWVYYDSLRLTDEVWGYNPETGQTGWVRIVDKFSKMQDGIYTFKAGKVNCKVTGDHKMIAVVDGEKRVGITAKDLYNLLMTSEYKLLGEKAKCVQLLEVADGGKARPVEIKMKGTIHSTANERVWDLTMEKWHYFATRQGGGSPVFLSNCYDMDTEVFVKERGWVKPDELQPNDTVYTYNKELRQAEWSGFHNFFIKRYTGTMYNIKTRKLDLLVTPDHKMLYKSIHEGYDAFELDEMSNILERDIKGGYDIPISAELEYTDADAVSVGVLPYTDEKDLELFWEFVGFYIGDGHLYDKDMRVNFGFKKERKIEFLTSLMDSLDIKHTVLNTGNGTWQCNITDGIIVDFLYEFVGCDKQDKRIPWEKLEGRYYKSLLDGLLFADGTLDSRQLEFSTVSEALKNDVEYILTLLGYAYNTTFREKFDTRYMTTYSWWRINVYKYNTTVFKPKSVSAIEYDGFVWDLTTDNDNHNFLVRRNGHVAFSGNCGTGNLMLEADHDRSKLFLSSLQDTDIETIRNNPAFEGATAFQLNFLEGIDYDRYNTEFLDKLPHRLKEAIVNDEPIIFFDNPPYKSGVAKATDVGRHMCSIGYNKSAYDLFYQFCWRVMNFVEMFDLHNVYYCFFGPLTFFTGSSANVLFKDFQRHFEFIDGMCISAQDFSGTSQSIEWGIGCSLWKACGEDGIEGEPKKVLLEKKMFDMDGDIITGGRTLYTAPRERMDEWLQPKDVLYYNEAPLATSHLTFKGSDEGVLVAKYSGKIADGALGTMMLDSTLARGNTYTAILSLPTSIQFVNITKENFWRCVSSFAFRNVYQASWSETRKWLSAPDTSVEGYNTWLANALVIFLCELKSMQSGIRGIKWCGEKVDVSNRLFFVTEDEFRASCNDDLIIDDFDNHGFHNEFVLSMIEQSKELWTPEVKELFQWCKDVILNTYDIRKDRGYKGCLIASDAGLAQLRYGVFSQEANQHLFDLLNKARSSVNKDLSRFGFLCETEM